MPGHYDFSKERELTNKEFAAEIATKTGLTADEIQRLLPKKEDLRRKAELRRDTRAKGFGSKIKLYRKEKN